jgi:hypothetical protein
MAKTCAALTDSYRPSGLDRKTGNCTFSLCELRRCLFAEFGDQFSSLTSITQQVKPEKFSNYEVGAKWDIRNNLSVTTAL